MSAKPRSRVTRTRDSSLQIAAIWGSTLPPSSCPITLKASQPAARRIAANSSGRFSSVLNRMWRIGREVDNPLSRELSRIGYARVDPLSCHGRIAAQDLVGRHVRGEVVQNDRDRNASADQARLTVTDVWLDGDVFAPVHRFFILPPCSGNSNVARRCSTRAAEARRFIDANGRPRQERRTTLMETAVAAHISPLSEQRGGGTPDAIGSWTGAESAGPSKANGAAPPLRSGPYVTQIST